MNPPFKFRASAVLASAVMIAGCAAAPPDSGSANAAEVAASESPTAEAAPAAPPPAPKPAVPVRADFEFDRMPEQGGVILARVPTGTSAVSLDGNSLLVTDDGYVLLGFNRDAEPNATLSWVQDGETKSRILQVKKGNWRIERVNLSLPRGRKASERRARELAQIGAARAKSHDVDGWRQKFIWPTNYREVAGGRLSGFFGSQRYYRGTPGGYHTGLDIAAPTGTPFVAPADGVVTLATKIPFSREGYLLMMDHGMGLNSAFVHCSAILVQEGERVKQGQVIGRIGRTGSATGPHLHWSMKWNAARVDPLLMLPKI